MNPFSLIAIGKNQAAFVRNAKWNGTTSAFGPLQSPATKRINWLHEFSSFPQVPNNRDRLLVAGGFVRFPGLKNHLHDFAAGLTLAVRHGLAVDLPTFVLDADGAYIPEKHSFVRVLTIHGREQSMSTPRPVWTTATPPRSPAVLTR